MIAAPEVPSHSERGGFRETVDAGKYTGQLSQKGLRDTSLPATHPMQLQERSQRAVQMAQGSTPMHGFVILRRTLCV